MSKKNGKPSLFDEFKTFTQERKDIYRLGSCQRLPHTIGDIEKSTQSGKSFGDTRHLRAEGHHIHIQTLEYLMQIVKVYC